ncbi:MAG: leucyl/phenylalanyl-tRNA--protein transferase [Pikeienuella sp.]
MSDRSQEFRLTPDILLRAYASGVFPMAESAQSDELMWIDPELRGIIPLNDFHLPKSLRKTIRRADFKVRVDADFEGTIDACAQREATWINAEIRRLYIALHRMGYAHSVEVYSENEMVGGLYGVRIGAAFFGESMFSTATDASKIALVYLVARLKIGGFTLLDTQFVTSHLAGFGATEIPREQYKSQLHSAIMQQADFDELDEGVPPYEVAQLSTQIS